MPDSNAPPPQPLRGGIEILPYSSEHREGVRSVFLSNVPEYFRTAEEALFFDHVESGKGPFVVLVKGREIIGCGGFALRGDTADLCWGMVHRNHHGMGLGDALMIYRLMAVIQTPARHVRLETSQRTENFFLRYGFSVAERIPDGFGPGLDKVEMRAELDGVFRKLIAERLAKIGFVPSNRSKT